MLLLLLLLLLLLVVPFVVAGGGSERGEGSAGSRSSSSSYDSMSCCCRVRRVEFPQLERSLALPPDAAELVRVLPKTGIEAELSGKVGRAPLRKSSYFTRPWEGGEVECEGAAPQKTIAGAVLEVHVASFSRNSLEGFSNKSGPAGTYKRVNANGFVFYTNRQFLSSDKLICPNFFLAPQGRRGQVSRLK